MVDSCGKGECKKCNEKRDFSQPLFERLTRKEVRLIRDLGKGEYYLQGHLHIREERGI